MNRCRLASIPPQPAVGGYVAAADGNLRMDRAGVLMGPMGFVVVAIMIVSGLILYAVRGSKRRRVTRDAAFDPEFDDAEPESKSVRPGEYPDFTSLLNRFVLPLAQANPRWERLDGAQDVPGQPIAWFYWNGTRYSVGGETHVRALRQTMEWMLEHPGVDPLLVLHTERGAGRLTLRPEIGWKDAKAVRIETG